MRQGENLLLAHVTEPLLIALGWEDSEAFTLSVDAHLFLLNSNNTVINDRGLIFYNQQSTICGSVCHITSLDADLIKGREGFLIDLPNVQSDIHRLVIGITHRGDVGESLRALAAAKLALIDTTDNTTVACYVFADDIHDESALIVGEIYRHKGDWKFRAIGQGFTGGLSAMATHFGVRLQQDATPTQEQEWVEEDNIAGVSLEPQRKRRSPHEMLAGHSQHVRVHLERLIPKIMVACTKEDNESNTRMILDRVLQDVLGYAIENIKTEKDIEGRRADYVLSVKGQDVIVIEAKRAGISLKKRHIFQATSYGAFAGIRWVLLTNLVEWQLYRIATGEKMEAHLVFTVNLKDGIDDESLYYLTLISYYGMTRQGLLERLWLKLSKLSSESLTAVLLSQEVVNKIRTILSKDLSLTLTHGEVRAAIERNVLRLV